MKQTALITGASKRIGKAIALHLAARGWNIIVHYNTSGIEAEKLVGSLSEKYPNQNCRSIQANLSNINEVVGLIPSIIAKSDVFQLLVNNASVFDKSYFNETSIELYEAQMTVNLMAPFFLMRDYTNYCKSGNIINFVDTRVNTNATNFAVYSLSKKGLWDATKMAALEMAPNIRVNAIAPGVTLAPTDEDDNYLKNLAKNIPMKVPGGIDPILSSIDYILENNHLTGQLLYADGGENLGGNK